MSDEERQDWASHLMGRVTTGGLLELQAVGPWQLASAGENSGPELMIGDVGSRAILFFPGQCEPLTGPDIVMVNGFAVDRSELDNSQSFASWCVPKEFMTVHVYGPDEFIDSVLNEVKLERTVLASD
jgi:hypothetical protein